MTATTIKFDAVWDDEAKVYVATSPSHNITTEAPNRKALEARLQQLVPDVLDARHYEHARDVLISIDWLELQAVDHSEFAVA